MGFGNKNPDGFVAGDAQDMKDAAKAGASGLHGLGEVFRGTVNQSLDNPSKDSARSTENKNVTQRGMDELRGTREYLNQGGMSKTNPVTSGGGSAAPTNAQSGHEGISTEQGQVFPPQDGAQEAPVITEKGATDAADVVNAGAKKLQSKFGTTHLDFSVNASHEKGSSKIRRP